MRLALKSALLLIVFYGVGMGAMTLWLGYSRIRSESAFIEETLALLGREKAAALDEAIRDTDRASDLLAQGRLRMEIESSVANSGIVTSISVVDSGGRVTASDRLDAGAQLAPPHAIFKGKGPAEAFALPSRGLFRRQEHMLYLPLWRGEELAGYMRITFESERIQEIVLGIQKRLYVEMAIGLGLIAIGAIFLQAQLTRQARVLTRELDAAIASEPSGARASEDEFASVFQAAQRVRSALADARREGTQAGQRIGALTDVLRVGLVWCRPDKGLDFANRRALELFGVESLDALKSEWGVVAAPAVAAMQAIHGNGSARSEPVTLAVGSPPRMLRVQVYCIETKGCEGFIGLVTDPEIVEVLEEDVRLAAQMQSLARVYRTAVHELRSPLSAIIVNMDLLRDTFNTFDRSDPSVQEIQQRYVAVVQDEMTRLNDSLVQMLTHVAPLTRKQEKCDLRALIVDLGTLIGEQARRQGVDVTMNLPQSPLVVTGHSDRIKQAFLNIVVNALEAMPRGGTLDLNLHARDGLALARFTDTGRGLPEGLIEKIFEKDFTTKSGGTGTGLFVARALVEQHGGAIRATSTPGTGTSFEIALPLTPKAAKES